MNDLADFERMLDDSAALPALLHEMQFDLSLLDREPRPVDLIDGHILPRGTTTLIATDPGSGKSTSVMVSGASAAHDGTWTMFGRRKHDRPLRVAIISGEDNERSLEAVFAGLPAETRDHIRSAATAGRLVISPFRKWASKKENPDLFDADGKLSTSGHNFAAAMRQFGPDIIALDTIASLSKSLYMDRSQAYSTINMLNDLADDLDCAILVMMHLNRDGGAKLGPDVSADELTGRLAGSAGWRAAARHVIAMAQCPEGLFDGISIENSSDSKWIAAIKTNLMPDAAKEVFPVIRSRECMVLQTVNQNGTPLLDSNITSEKEVQALLRPFLRSAIAAAARMRTPFAQRPQNKFSAEKLFAGALSEVCPTSSNEHQIRRAIEALDRAGQIVACTTSRSGSSVVWDVPAGDYANESRYEAQHNEKLPFNKGAAPAPDDLRAAIEELEREEAEVAPR